MRKSIIMPSEKFFEDQLKQILLRLEMLKKMRTFDHLRKSTEDFKKQKPMSTVCKFTIISKEKSETHVYNKNHPVPVCNVSMIPVYSGGKENESFFASTPGGQINLSVVNRDAMEGFEVGDEVYVRFEKAEKA